MKVVLFCGGEGTRIRDYSDKIPKPLVPIGQRPLLWHLMRYYAHFGHKEFILCLGYKGDAIKRYFLDYNEALSNDFVLSAGGKKVELIRSDIDDWTMTFVDTGLKTNIGGRLMAVQHLVRDEPMFLANYADGLTDFDLSILVEMVARSKAVGAFLSVRPQQSFHFVKSDPDGWVKGVDDIDGLNAWVNGGFFCLRPAIFDYMNKGEELVEEPFNRLARERLLLTAHHKGFWRCCDTFKDLQALERLEDADAAPWKLWRTGGA